MRRSVTFALLVVLAALPSLTRVCLTGCDVAMLTSAHEGHAVHGPASRSDRDGSGSCPLHDGSAVPDQPPSPRPCQHQPEIANPNAAKSPAVAFAAADSAIWATPPSGSGPTAAVSTFGRSTHQILFHPALAALVVLRI